MNELRERMIDAAADVLPEPAEAIDAMLVAALTEAAETGQGARHPYCEVPCLACCADRLLELWKEDR
jgi:hypothetical protein